MAFLFLFSREMAGKAWCYTVEAGIWGRLSGLEPAVIVFSNLHRKLNGL